MAFYNDCISPSSPLDSGICVCVLSSVQRNVINEIVETERIYLGYLDVILRYFLDPVKVQRLLSSSDIDKVFGNIKSIRALNQVLLDDLVMASSIFNGEAVIASISAVFVKLGPFLKLYSVYAVNYNMATAFLIKLADNPTWSRWLQSQLALPATGMQGFTSLDALLVKPVQRIMKYELLLGQLLKNTPKDWLSYSVLQEAVTMVKSVADYCNEHTRDNENMCEILRIQRSFGKRNQPKLMKPGRKLLKKGPLTQISVSGRFCGERTVWLFTDDLAYATPTSGNQHRHLVLLPLHHCRAKRMAGTDRLTVTCKNRVQVHFRAPTWVSATEWDVALNNSIDEASKRRKGLLKQSTMLENDALGKPVRVTRRTSTLTRRLREKYQQQHPEESVQRRSLRSNLDCFGLSAGVRKRRSCSMEDTSDPEDEFVPTQTSADNCTAKRPRLSTVPEEEISLGPPELEDDGQWPPSGLKRQANRGASSEPWWKQYDRTPEQPQKPTRLAAFSCSMM